MIQTNDNGHGPDDSRESMVADAVDEFRERWARGEQPDAEEYAARFPPVASELRRLLPALAALDAAGPDADGETPSAIGDFRIRREIGRGGMAVVYEAEQRSLSRTVALKVLPFAAVMDSRQLQRFKNEAQAAAHLHHGHIVPVHSIGCERGVHYYAMQYIEGLSVAQMIEELRALARRNAPSGSSSAPLAAVTKGKSTQTATYCRAVARLGIQAAQALDHAHQQGVVHRDIKPANLLVDASGHLWITDFGLASFTSQPGLTITGDIVGTVRYMSPEQALAKRVPIDHRTDVYSLGVTLYELLTLKTAFPGNDPHKVIQDIASKEPKPARSLNGAVPPELETILLKAMAKDAADRFATAQELADDLARYLKDEPIHARRPTLAQRAGKWARRHAALVWSVAAVLMLAVAGLTAGATLLWREQARTARAYDAEARQRTRAETTLALALEALDNVYLDEAEVTPKVRPGLSRSLLEEGLGFYERFAAANRDSPEVHRATGLAQVRAALIYRELGREEEALAAFEAAMPILREAIRLDPDNVKPRHNLGLALEALGRADEAVVVFREAVRLLPDSERAHGGLGWALWRSGRIDEAIVAFRDAIRLEPNYAFAHNDLGLCLSDSGQAEQALAEFREAIRLLPDDPRPHHNLGNELRKANRFEEAMAAYRDAIRCQPDYAAAHYNLGLVLHEKGRFDEAIAAWREVIRLDPGEAITYRSLGLGLAAKGQFDDAVAALREAIRLDPDLADAHRDLGGALFKKGLHEEAAASFREAIRLEPGNAWTHSILGTALARGGLLEDAIAAYREAVRLQPELAEAHINLGCALSEKGLQDEAIAAFREAIVMKPEHAGARYGLAKALECKRLVDEAIAEYREAIRLRPNYAFAHNDLGICLSDSGQPEQAIAAFREAIRLLPDDPRPHHNLAKELRNANRLDEAIAAWREVIRLDPDDAEAHCSLGATLCDGKHDYDGAIAAFQQVIRLDPKDADARYNLGNALMGKRLLDDAIAAWREAVRLEPDHAHAYNKLGAVLCDGKRDYDGAIAAFQQVIRLQPDFAPAHFNLGNALYGKGLFEDAIAAYREAVRLRPDFVPAHINLANVFHRVKRFAEARAAYEYLLKLDPCNAAARHGLAHALAGVGDFEGAVAHHQKLIRLKPEAGPCNCLAWLLATCPDEAVRNPDEAVRLAKKAVSLMPRLGSRTLGIAYYRAGHIEEAVRALEESVRLLGGGDARDWLFLAMTKWHLGSRDEARAFYEKSLAWMKEHAPDDPELKRFAAEAADLLGSKKND